MPLNEAHTMNLLRIHLMLLALVAALSMLQGCAGDRDENVIRVGCKDFTEQFILGEIVAQIIEAQTDLTVRREFNLGTGLAHKALVGGEIDLYVEYTGTALLAVLGIAPRSDPAEVYPTVRDAYAERFNLRWLSPLGFNNTYALAVRRDDAQRHAWRTISDLQSAAPRLRAGFTSEFMERPDGYPGLRSAYDLSFASARDIDPSLMYRALAQDQLDVICAFATDGRIEKYDLVLLEDDRRFFPPYDAAIVFRNAVLERHPALKPLLGRLAGAIDDPTMRRLNFQVDEHKRPAREVASEFLLEEGIVTHEGGSQE